MADSEVNLVVDTERFKETRNPFPNEEARKNFARKVYLIIFFQHLLSSGFTNLSVNNNVLRAFRKNHKWITIVPLILSIICLIIALIKRNLTTKVPINFILLSIFGLTKSLAYSTSISFNYLFNERFAILTGFIIVGLVLITHKVKKGYSLIVEITFVFLCYFVGICYDPQVLNFPIFQLVDDLLFLIFVIISTHLFLKNLLPYQIDSNDYILASLITYVYIYVLYFVIYVLLIAIGYKDYYSVATGIPWYRLYYNIN